MSWDAYCDNLMQYPGVNAAFLGGHSPAQVYAQKGIAVSQAEMTSLAAFLAAAADKREPSITLGGQKYMVLRSDDTLLEGKMKAHTVSVRKTKTLIVVALHVAKEDEASEQSMGPKVAQASTTVSDYLISKCSL